MPGKLPTVAALVTTCLPMGRLANLPAHRPDLSPVEGESGKLGGKEQAGEQEAGRHFRIHRLGSRHAGDRQNAGLALSSPPWCLPVHQPAFCVLDHAGRKQGRNGGDRDQLENDKGELLETIPVCAHEYGNPVAGAANDYRRDPRYRLRQYRTGRCLSNDLGRRTLRKDLMTPAWPINSGYGLPGT